MKTAKRFSTGLLLIASLLFLHSCTAVQPYYKDDRYPETSFDPLPRAPLEYEVFLVGDAGEPKFEYQTPPLRLLEKHLNAASDRSTVVFLGDNIYPIGLPPIEQDGSKSEERLLMERKLNASLDILENYSGRKLFIPGNHDWNKGHAGGLEYIISQQEYVSEYLNDKDAFEPRDGCSGPVEIPLTPDLLLLVIDSHWWLHTWEKEDEINENCENKTRAEFATLLELTIQRNADKQIILVMHHPLFTQGIHGGYYTPKQHLFPLTEAVDWLYLPLPIIGSLYPLIRGSGISPQDNANKKFKEMKTAVIDAADNADDVVFAAGHEHGLQYFEVGKHNFIVSGGGCKSDPVRKGKKAEFAHSHTGFSKLYYYSTGELWIEFWEPIDKGDQGRMVFRKKIVSAGAKR